MEAVTGQSLLDALKNHQWIPGAERVLINLSDVNIDELKESKGIGFISEIILSKDITFFGLGNESNKEQYNSLITATSNDGLYIENSDINSAVSTIEEKTIKKILSKDYMINEYVVKEEAVSFKEIFKDSENDQIFDTKWKYTHENLVFDNDEGIMEESEEYLDQSISIFNKVGKYLIRVKVKDNPARENENLEGYRLWSDEEKTKKEIIVHRRPIADLAVIVSPNILEGNLHEITIKENFYDKDHENEENKGIVEKQYYWKNIKDENWTVGQVPNKLPSEEDYIVLVKVKVKDKEGFYSEPKAKYFSTRNWR